MLIKRRRRWRRKESSLIKIKPIENYSKYKLNHIIYPINKRNQNFQQKKRKCKHIHGKSLGFHSSMVLQEVIFHSSSSKSKARAKQNLHDDRRQIRYTSRHLVCLNCLSPLILLLPGLISYGLHPSHSKFP